jgi:hypothetical protein
VLHPTNFQFVGAFILYPGIVPTMKRVLSFCARIPRLESRVLHDEEKNTLRKGAVALRKMRQPLFDIEISLQHKGAVASA